MVSKTMWLIIFGYFLILPKSSISQIQEILSDQGYFSDYELDYYPHFKAGMDLEFYLVFKTALKICGYEISEIKQISGTEMRVMGIPPKEWEGRAKFRVLIDEKGNIIDVSFWGTPLQADVKSCFLDEIRKYRLNPALINLRPVKCKFTYLLIELPPEPNKKKQKNGL